MLNQVDLNNIRGWKYNVQCDDVVAHALNPFYNWIVKLVPYWVAPNMLSLMGLVCTVLAFISTMMYGNFFATAFFIAVYMILDDIDGKHSRRIGNSSPLGELFDHFCDCISNVLVSHCICFIIIPFINIQTPIVWTAMLYFTYEHYKAYNHPKKLVHFKKFTGPTAILTMVIVMFTLFGIIFGNDPEHVAFANIVTQYKPIGLSIDWFQTMAAKVYEVMPINMSGLGTVMANSNSGVRNIIQNTFVTYIVLGLFVLYIISKMVIYSGSVKNGIVVALTVLINYSGMINALKSDNTWFPFSHNSLLTHNIMAFVTTSSFCFALSILCADFIVAKMANRSLSYWVILAQIVTANVPLLGLPVTIGYFYYYMSTIATFMNLPVLRTNVRMFVSGYYDGFHEGHVNSLRVAREHCDQLIVGVHSDADSMKYKNKKPMNDDAVRVAAVKNCQYVDVVIPKCQQVFDEKFMIQHGITLVGFSDEYIKYDASGNVTWVHESYVEPYAMGRYFVIPRTPGISSTLLREQQSQQPQADTITAQ